MTKPKKSKLKKIPLLLGTGEAQVSASAFDLGALKRPEVVKKKKKKEVAEEEPVKKKRKKKSQANFAPEESAMAEVRERAEQLPALKHHEPNDLELQKLRDAKRSMRNLEGTFKKYSPEAAMLIEREQIGSSAQLIQRGMLMMLLDSIPIAEDAYHSRPSQSNAIALQALINTGRDVLAEIEQTNDGTELLSALMNEVMLPNFHEIAHHLVMALFHLREQVQNVVPDNMRRVVDGKFNDIAQEIRVYLSEKFVDLRERTMERLKEG